MIFSFFDTRETIAFAKEIADELRQNFPNAPTQATPKSLRKGHRKLDGIVAKTQAFALEKRPNIYKKAKFLNTIKWELKKSNHNTQFVDEIVRLLANTMQ